MLRNAKMVFLSATLSYEKRQTLYNCFNLSRKSSNAFNMAPKEFILVEERKNLIYQLYYSNNQLEELKTRISKISWNSIDDRGMIFFRTKSECLECANSIESTTFYFGEGFDIAESEKKSPNNMKNWKKGQYRWIACTCGASLGIDYPSVTFVFVVDKYNNTKQELDLIVQQFGRAGRDSQDSICTILTTLPKEHNSKSEWVDNICLRTQIDGCLENSPICVSLDISNLQYCSVCLDMVLRQPTSALIVNQSTRGISTVLEQADEVDILGEEVGLIVN